MIIGLKTRPVSVERSQLAAAGNTRTEIPLQIQLQSVKVSHLVLLVVPRLDILSVDGTRPLQGTRVLLVDRIPQSNLLKFTGILLALLIPKTRVRKASAQR